MAQSEDRIHHRSRSSRCRTASPSADEDGSAAASEEVRMRAEMEAEMSAWSKDGLDRLDELVTRHVGVDGVPGAAWLVAREGEVHGGAAGTIDGSAPVARDSIVRH